MRHAFQSMRNEEEEEKGRQKLTIHPPHTKIQRHYDVQS